jgi:hypothetical protein
MRPDFHYELMQARATDLHHHGQREALANAAGAARPARPELSRRASRRLPAATRWCLPYGPHGAPDPPATAGH